MDNAMTELLSESSGGREIAIRPDHQLAKALLRLVALVIWVTGGFGFIKDFRAESLHSIPISVWLFMLIWSGGGIVLALDSLWILFGVQQVLIQSQNLTVTRRIGPVSISKPKTFAIAHVRRMRVEENRFRLRGKTIVNHTVTFDYLGKKRLLLSNLSAQRAESLLSGPLHRFASD
jgi:hypothetical protein